jgi:SWI/SNF-related matrix-associated actin-dependent regulator 1 of chromatin subfamily A
MLHQVRSIVGRRYHKAQDCWSIPLFTDNIETLLGWGFSLDEKLNTYYQKSKARIYEREQIDVPGLKGTLRPFQNWGVRFTEEHNGRILNADDMGLGKTIESLGWLQLHRDKIPVIIVCPSVAKLMWERAIHNWLPKSSSVILCGERPYPFHADFIIINYDILSKWINKLQRKKAQVIILDECHYIKSDRAKRTKAVKRLAKGIPHILCLSGTPIENKPVEIYNAWQLVDPINCPNYWSFTKRFCKRKKNFFGGWDVSGTSNVEELHKILTGTIMLRRRKADVLKDLPTKVPAFIPMYLHNKKEYEDAEADFIAYLRKVRGDVAANRAMKAKALAKMEVLKQLAVQGKLPEVIEWIKDFLEVENKLVVFAWHTFVIDAIMEAFPKIAIRVDGKTKDKQACEDKFQKDPDCHLFVGQMKAAGVSLTLTAASNVGIIEYPWTPGTLNQAIDRVHRITQLGSVTVYYFMAQNTIEESTAKKLDKKQKMIGAVIDGDENPMDTTLFEDLMREYAEKGNLMIRTKY